MELKLVLFVFLGCFALEIVLSAPTDKEEDFDPLAGSFGINGNCTFDDNFCNWVNARSGDSFDWTRNKINTPSSNTGPAADVNGNGQYIYIETSHPRKKGQTASLISGPYIGVMCMQFYYHMKGSQIGDLQIYMSERGPVGQTFIWGKYGQQGNQWKYDNVTVYGFAFDILIVARVGGGYEGDIAMDEIIFTPGTCYSDEDREELLKRRLGEQDGENSTTKGTCDFDTDLCGWSDDIMDDVFDWEHEAEPTSTKGTGPDKDHGGKRGGRFLYVEASSPRRRGDRARLLSPQLCGQVCLRFYYHMYGSGMGALNVMRKEGVSGKDDRLWYTMGNKGTEWQRAIVEMNSDQDCYQVIIEAIIGSTYTSDLAIDDVYVQKGSCCDMKSELSRVDKTGNCNFDKSFCGWTNLNIDDFDWTLGRGKTRSDHTGPDGGFGNAGGYAFIEASEPRFVGDTAIIASGYLLGSMCMRFRYHMHGEDVGSLSVFRNGDGVMQQLLWQQDGNQGNTWHEAEFYIDCNVTSYLVEIEASVGGWRGDIAIDNVHFTPGACPYKPVFVHEVNHTTAVPVLSKLPEFDGFCNFGSGFCRWKNDLDDYCDFVRQQGPTATLNTGPLRDLSGDGYYIYLEASNRRPGEFARLLSGSLKDTLCLKFYYNMFGEGIGDLRVEMRESENYSWNTTWSTSGNQGQVWKLVSLTISGYDYVVAITAVRGRNFLGDIAVDSIALAPGPCLGDGFVVGAAERVKLVDCYFENGFCEWKNVKKGKNVTGGKGDDFDWIIRKGRTPTSETGPDSDHSGSGHYMYIESSSPRTNGDKARITTMASQDVCMRFFYHMYGNDIGGVNIYQSDNISNKLIWKRNGDKYMDNKWKDASIFIQGTSKYSITIEGVRGKGYRGDIAIDDITFVPGPCGSTQKPKRRGRRRHR